MEINIEKLIKNIDDTKCISEEDMLKRELLEICYKNRNGCKVIDLSKFNSHIFLEVYKELMKEDYDDMLLIKDMIKSEFLSENLLYIEPFEDDDEIY